MCGVVDECDLIVKGEKSLVGLPCRGVDEVDYQQESYFFGGALAPCALEPYGPPFSIYKHLPRLEQTTIPFIDR